MKVLFSTMRRIVVSLAAIGSVLATLPAVPASAVPATVPASAAPVDYVNLGDSYSAGAGVMPKASGSDPRCTQSGANFAHLVARRTGARLTDVSCGGAKTDDFFRSQFPGVRPQLRALTARTQLVTVMIGGNDGDVFGNTVAHCALASVSTVGIGAPCAHKYGRSIADTIRNQTFPKLVRAFRAVRAAAPHARVAAVSYPWILPAKPVLCPAFPVAPGDIPYTHGIQQTLNDAVRRAAVATGVTYVDATTPSTGHDSCAPKGVRWIEPLITDVQPVPVHPNALGEREMAAVTLRALMPRR